MKRVIGALLMAGSAACSYLFAARILFHGRASLGGEFSAGLPFRLVGMDYPADALLLAGAGWGLVLGLYHVLTGTEDIARVLQGGRVARLALLNGLLLVTTLAVACVGAKHGKEGATVAVFALTAAAQVVLGLVLLVLALAERPKGIVSLVLGGLVTAGGVAVAVFAFLQGGA
jgi:hypothetical protein